jgi:hypothetical protein
MTCALCACARVQRALLERGALPGLVGLLGDAQADGAYAAAAALFNACAMHADAREATLAALTVGPLIALLSADSWYALHSSGLQAPRTKRSCPRPDV